MIVMLLLLFLLGFVKTESLSSSLPSLSSTGSNLPRVAVVGGGISGLTIAHVLQQSGRYSVHVLEAQPKLGGHIRSKDDPMTRNETSGKNQTTQQQQQLNIGHATHMGMFLNLRLLLRHFNIPEWPVGNGPNDQPGLFRMISTTATTGQMFQPPIQDIWSISCWWQAFVFYYDSYLDPEQRLDSYLNTKKTFYSSRFLDILYWAMATFEFDKLRDDESGEYALGTARALLITQVFFQYLLCGSFQGRLPARIDRGLKKDLVKRIQIAIQKQDWKQQNGATKKRQKQNDLIQCLEQITSPGPVPMSLASYYTADYGTAVERLAAGAGRVWTNSAVSRVFKKPTEDSSSNARNEKQQHKPNDILVVETINGDCLEVDAVVFAIHPSIIVNILSKNPSEFQDHKAVLQCIDSGAVGVRIMHAKDLPFYYPPLKNDCYFKMHDPPPILGIFDISELTTTATVGAKQVSREKENSTSMQAGWLSVAYPVYRNTTLNRHEQLLQQMPCLDETIYSWTRATSSFPKARRGIVDLQGYNGIYITGQALTGVNKASELQVTNALILCRDHFGVDPPWTNFFPCPMLPDCNDVDAFAKNKSSLEAAALALKSLVGSFLLASAVTRFGVELFE